MNEIQEDIDALGLDQVTYAKLLGVTGSTVRRWISGDTKRPAGLAAYTKLILDDRENLPKAWMFAGFPPEGPPMSPAGRPVNRSD